MSASRRKNLLMAFSLFAMITGDWRRQVTDLRLHSEATLSSDPAQTHQRFAAGPATIVAVLDSFTRQAALK